MSHESARVPRAALKDLRAEVRAELTRTGDPTHGGSVGVTKAGVQHLYAWGAYAMVFLKWVWFEHFDDYMRRFRRLSNARRVADALEIGASKLSHVLIFIALPMLVIEPWAAGLFYAVHFFAVGMMMAVTFVVAHVGDVQAMPETRTDGPHDWALFQLATTANFATRNRWLGGLNHQVEHHLFPALHHRHYPRIRPIVMRWALAHGATYHELPTFRAAIGAHVRHLRQLGRRPVDAASSSAPRPGVSIASKQRYPELAQPSSAPALRRQSR